MKRVTARGNAFFSRLTLTISKRAAKCLVQVVADSRKYIGALAEASSFLNEAFSVPISTEKIVILYRMIDENAGLGARRCVADHPVDAPSIDFPERASALRNELRGLMQTRSS
jgi:hypothetical protein